MKIAVTSQNYKTVTNHAGKARRYIIFETNENGSPQEVERLDLPKEMSFSMLKEGSHPIDGVDVVLSGSFGDGFARRMSKRGIIASLAQTQDPVEAIKEYLTHGQKLPTSSEK